MLALDATGWSILGVGLTIFFGLLGIAFHRGWFRRMTPADVLREEKAAEELRAREDERQAAEQAQQEAEAQEERRAALLRDMDRMRRAIMMELRALPQGQAFAFSFGPPDRSDVHNRRRYRLQGDELFVEGSRRGSSGRWDWSPGLMPCPHNEREQVSRHVRELRRVEATYELLRYERLLVQKHFPNDPLECDEPAP